MDEVQRKINLVFRGAGPPLANLELAADIVCSEINHRKYDQLMTYKLKVDLDAAAAPGTYEIYALQDTWMMKQAIAMAHAVYNVNTKEERAMMEPKMLAKWGGFRLQSGLPATTHSDACGSQKRFSLSPYDYIPVNTAEIYFSEVTGSSGQATFGLTGATTANFYNIIEQLDLSQNSIPSPSTVNAEIPYDGIEVDVSTSDATYEHLQQDGNLPPYARNDFETNVWTLVGTLHIDANGNQKLSTGYFDAPLGMVILQGYNGQTVGDNPPLLSVEFQRGSYQGVHATPVCSKNDISRWEGKLDA
jgi:hypothetical protein